MSLVEGGEGCVVLVTAPDPETAARLARSLLEARLIACANVVPGVRSIYRYQGALHDECEQLIILKTQRAKLGALEALLEAEHPYEVPELLALPILAGSQAYLSWMGEALEDDGLLAQEKSSQ